MSELDVLLPQPVELVIAGQTLHITPLKVGQLPGLLRAIAPVAQQLSASEIDWLTLFGEHGDQLLAAIAIASGQERSWVDGLATDEAIVLAATLIEVNAECFTRTVLPKLDGVLTARLPGAAPAGSTPSSS